MSDWGAVGGAAAGVVACLGALALVGVVGVKAAVVLGLLRGGFGGRGALPGPWVALIAAAVGLVVASAPLEASLARIDGRDPAVMRPDDWAEAAAPVAAFFARNSDLEARQRLAARADLDPDDWRAALPAFIARALTDGFRVGFWLLLPLMAVDVLVGLVLASGGLAQVPARALTLPLKALVFITADGWALLIEGLVTGYQ
jgi:type III secretory pathway component EscR